jgi:hypothetical protein
MKRLAKFTLASLAAVTLIATAAAQAGGAKKQTEANRARGLFISKKSDAMSILIQKVDGGLLVPVDPSTEFKAGDQIKIQFQSNFEGYIYVVNIAPSGKRRVLFPYTEASNNAVTPDERYDLPPGGDAIEFDAEKGTEVIQVIMSKDRIAYLDAALKDPERYLSESASSAAAELKGGITKKVTPVVPESEGSKVRSRDIILAAGRDKEKSGSVVAIPDNGGGGKLKSGEIAPFEIRLKHK